ncbi:serine/threonine-protein kinase [Spirillospora albida]|uniref:serine/threonine-protein kinase n=1 Tax=Spirillospora albida TaxID=58123 RepID=UPI0012FAC4C1|nr:serine/threonine-protein kinase [Spirillospora albida]
MAFTVVDGWTVPGFTHERELGTGALGRVVLAVDDQTSTKVAINYLHAGPAADEAFMAAYRAAARSLSHLEDPNVVDLFDFVEGADGAAIIMGRVDGVSLRRVLGVQRSTGPLAALSMFGGMLLGLAAAHGHGIVHGSLRPSSVFVDGQGNCLLSDFATAPAGTEAQHGPQYAAPELWDGAPATVATDLYAATALFYECLTGRPPYTGRNLAKQHREGPIPAEEVPGPLRTLVIEGLAKDPADRPKTAADLLGALEDAAVAAYGPSWEAQGRGRLAELSAQAAALPEPKPARSSGRHPVVGAAQGTGGGRTRWIAAAVAAALLAAGGIAGGMTLLKDDDTPPPPTPAQSSTPQPTLPEGGVNPGPLVARLAAATARTPSATFSYRRAGLAPATAKGTFTLVQGGAPAHSMTITGSGDTRKAARTVVLPDGVHVQSGKKWRKAPLNGQGYPALADQIRWSGSIAAITSLLESATSLRRSGTVYRGEAPLGELTGGGGTGPVFAEMARLTGAEKIGFAVRFDRSDRPVQLWMRALGPAKNRQQTVNAWYSGWGTKPPITAPR